MPAVHAGTCAGFHDAEAAHRGQEWIGHHIMEEEIRIVTVPDHQCGQRAKALSHGEHRPEDEMPR
jgi:hypothetical protein